ncbi:MAG: DEAD/DEAH box helicase, partial [Deltaproteobacteria bacterium]|nr:DEAD/DEAH box helicase [Deltaproteobacteria bacterium]
LRHRAGLGPALVVAPTTVVLNWQREAERFTPALRVRVLRGQAQLQLLDGLGPGDVVVTTYGLTTRYQDRLKALPFSTLVLDEAQAIKNPETQRARAVFHLQAPCRVALTGTPVENRAGELWSLFHAIAPGLLGSAESFRERFALPIERDRDQAAQELLARMIRPFVLRRLKAQVAPELPPRTEVRIDVELSREERVLYDELRASALAALAGVGGGGGANGGGEQQRRFQVLAALTRLRQLACHPQLVHPVTDVGSAKLAVLRELLAQLRHEGHRTLIFSQFTSHLALVRRMLEQEGVAFCAFDGSTPALQRRAEVDAFQGGSGEVFLLSLKAGGTGINLTAADYVVFLDPWWNPAVEDQAADRTHRIGQQRPVTIYRLVARDTIEEGILALQREKRELVQALLDGTGSAAALSTDELIGLIEASGRWSEAEPEEELEAETIPARSGTVQRRAAAASAAPAVPAAAGPGNGSSAAGDGPELLRRMELLLLRALAEGRLSNRATVRSYCRGAGRICEFAGAKGLPLDARSLEGIVASYRAELTRGSWPGPQSDAILARSVLHWMQNAAKLKEK